MDEAVKYLRALVTGGTDGIGRSIAVELARTGYEVHILGRSSERGEQVLEQLEAVAPGLQHRLFLVDLSSLSACRDFLDDYCQAFEVLDLMVLNANRFSTKVELSGDGIDSNFVVGCLSRVMFSYTLDPLLKRGDSPRVMHIGGLSRVVDIRYQKLSQPDYGVMRSLWQAATGSALLVRYFGEETESSVAHEFMQPGIVNTRTVTDRNFVIRWLSRMAGSIEPEECGLRIVRHLQTTEPYDVNGQFYTLEKKLKMPSRFCNAQGQFKALLDYSSSLKQSL
ncbi:SDR family NAD(P)-dependent oxidoreductase [Endozoicomonadaceae bacterium StTr2]